MYCSFEYSTHSDESDAGDHGAEEDLQTVACNMNFFRPRLFALESEPEVAAFVQQFELTVSDPQMSGMGDGELTRSGFLAGWNAGNEFAYRGCESQNRDQQLLDLPPAQHESDWQWNFQRKARQAALGETAFVPLIIDFAVQGRLRRVACWAEETAVLLPEVDAVLKSRKRLAPRKWLRGAREDNILLNWEDISPVVTKLAMMEDPVHYQVFGPLPPSALEGIVRAANPTHRLRNQESPGMHGRS